MRYDYVYRRNTDGNLNNHLEQTENPLERKGLQHDITDAKSHSCDYCRNSFLIAQFCLHGHTSAFIQSERNHASIDSKQRLLRELFSLVTDMRRHKHNSCIRETVTTHICKHIASILEEAFFALKLWDVVHPTFTLEGTQARSYERNPIHANAVENNLLTLYTSGHTDVPTQK